MPDPSETEGKNVGAEEAILEARRAKTKRLRDRGENPFANDVGPRLPKGETIDVGALRDVAATALDQGKYATDRVEAAANGRVFHVRGRCVTHRSAGGLTFLRLRDRTGEIQLLLSQDKLGADYAKLDDLDVGDIIEAEGSLTASKRGELSLEPARFRILTKSARPLPEKWHGLTDVETRYRQRYVDLIANPTVADAFRARGAIVRALRRTFDERGFLEVETPTLHTIIGGAAARPFLTHHNTLDMELYLRIAPELYLKRLLVGGLERVYEIGRCYRNEGISTRHNPEFTMLEFYWSYVTYRELLDFTEVMLREVDAALAQTLPAAHATWKKERPFTIDEPFVRLPMNQAVAEGAKRTKIAAWDQAVATKGGMGLVELLRNPNAGGAAPGTPGDPSARSASGSASFEFVDHIKEWSKSSPRAKAIDWSNFRKGLGKCDNDGERLFACYEYLVEPFLADDYRSSDGTKSLPVFVTDYPYETSPLARKNDTRPDLVDRFELFVHGRELCNAFSELNDPEDQAARFRDQVEKKAKGAEETMDYDADYIRALEHGMPPAAGFGMGIDRLAMMLTHQPSIRDVILFPLMREDAR